MESETTARDITTLRKVAEGREAEMFEWGDGKLLRLLRDGYGAGGLEREALGLEAARQSGVRVPDVFSQITVAGRHGMIVERLEGVDLLTAVGKQPWQVFRVGYITGSVHAAINKAAAPPELPALKDRLRDRIRQAGMPERLSLFALQRLDALAVGDRLCHGDFHPGNIMEHRGKVAVIDWTNATRGDPDADYARTRLMMRLGSLPPGTSVALRVMALFGRSLLGVLYDRSYRRARRVDMRVVRAWDVPVMAARLAEGIEEERPALLKRLEREAASA